MKSWNTNICTVTNSFIVSLLSSAKVPQKLSSWFRLVLHKWCGREGTVLLNPRCRVVKYARAATHVPLIPHTGTTELTARISEYVQNHVHTHPRVQKTLDSGPNKSMVTGDKMSYFDMRCIANEPQ